MSEDHDPIIDMGLEELLGGHKPPDLTARIVHAWHDRQLAQQASRHDGQEPGSPGPERTPAGPLAPVAEHPAGDISPGAICVGDNPTAGAPISGSSETWPVESLPSLLPRELPSRSANKSRNRRRAWRDWGLVVGAALAVAGSLILFAFVARSMLPANGGGEVVQNKQPPAKEAPSNELPSPASKGFSDATPPSAGDSALASSPRKSAETKNRADPAVGGTSPSRDVAAPPVETPVERSVAGADTKRSAPPEKPGNPDPKSASGVATATPSSGTSLVAALDDDAVVNRVNTLLRAGWAQSKVEPTARLPDNLWCERAFRIVLDRSPSTAELEKFTRSSDAHKRDDLLTSLVSSDAYAIEFANHWSRFWANRLMDPDDVSNNSVAGRDALAQYFQRGLTERTSFRDLAAGLLTATGTGVARAKDFNGAAAFLLVRNDRNDDKRVRATTEVARHFLGRSMECQQCHDDPLFDGGTQEQFWQLNSFLRQFAVVRDNKLPPRVADVDFRGENSKPNDAAVFFTSTKGPKAAFPVFLDGTAIPTSGVVKQVNRRKELATLITNSADFRHHIANQIWGAVVGKTFVPLDQKVRKNVMEHPEPLVVLGDQFAAHGFDLRKLVLWAVRSEPFQLSSAPESLADMTGGTNMPPFNQFYEQVPGTPRAARDLLAAALKVMGAEKLDSTTTARVGTVPPVDKKGIAKAPKPSGSIIQAGGATSDPMVRIILSSRRLDDKQRAEHLFQLAEHRPPRSAESKVLDDMLKKANSDPQEALRAIWAALSPLARNGTTTAK